MPDLEDLDQFKNIVNSLGNEPQILQERGETLQDVPRPEQGLPDDLNDLLGDTEDLAEEESSGDDLDELLAGFGEEDTEEEAAEETEEPFDDFSFDEDLDSLGDLGADLDEPEETPTPETSSEGPSEEGEEPPKDDELDLDALIAETSPDRPDEAEEPIEDIETEVDEAATDLEEGELEIGEEPEAEGEAGPEAEEPAAEAEEPVAEAFDDLGDLGDLDIDADLDDLGDFGEEPEAEGEAGPEAEEPAAEAEEPVAEAFDDLGDLGDLDIDADLGDLGDLGEEPEAEEPEGEAEAEEPTSEAEETAAEEIEEPAAEEFGEIDFENEFDLGEDTEFPFEDTGTEEEVEEAEEEEEIGEPDLDLDDVPTTDDFALPGEEDIEEVDEDFEVDQFDLGDLSEEFDLGEEEVTAEAEIGELPEAEALEAAGAGPGEFEITDEDFLNIRRTLGNLPRNLKMVIEELIGEKGLAGEDLKKMLDMLSAGESPKAIASVAGKITGKKIEIPESYAKKSGAEFEEEQESFAYIFKTKIFPYVKIGAAVLVVLGFLGFLGYRFVYKPLYANSLYKKGYEALQEEEYVPAEENFTQAYEVRPKKDWFYTYAEGYIEKKQYARAESMYDWLVREYPEDKKGYMDYAHLESNILSNYAKADTLLDEVLEENMYDFDALLASGDNFLEWGKEDPSKYENARVAYATLLQEYGGRPEILFRMLRYFIRTDNFTEVKRLKTQFQADPMLEINPHIYAELGGYLIDNNQLSDVKDILFRAMDVDRAIPEIHYHLARYYRELDDFGEEEKALRNALRLLQETSPLTTDRLMMLIDAHRRIGETHYRKEEYLQAEQAYQKGIELYEDARNRQLLGPAQKFGKLYADLGDVYYYVSGNLNTAYDLYIRAEKNLFSTPDVHYKKGFIQYGRENYHDSLMEFYEAAGIFSDNKNLMYATANNLYNRGEYFAAQGYYNHLLDILEQEEESIPFLMINEREDHRGIVEYLMKVYNNLGVTLNKLSEQSADSTKYSRSLAYLTRSTEYADVLSRDFETLERSNRADLAYLNMRSIMYPLAENEPQIYTNLPKDMEDLLF